MKFKRKIAPQSKFYLRAALVKFKWFCSELKSTSAKFKEVKFKCKIADKARKYANGAGRKFVFTLALNLAALAKS